MTYRKVSAFGIAVVLLLQIGCGVTDITNLDQPARGSDPSFGLVPVDVTDLLSCKPQPYVTNTQLIGSKGGKIKVGSHVLLVPAGALDRDVAITGEQVTGSINSVRFSPEGLTFAVPAQLTMSYDNCTAVLLPKRIAYTTELLKVTEVLPSKDKFQTKIVTSPIDHFSRYAVAY